MIWWNEYNTIYCMRMGKLNKCLMPHTSWGMHNHYMVEPCLVLITEKSLLLIMPSLNYSFHLFSLQTKYSPWPPWAYHAYLDMLCHPTPGLLCYFWWRRKLSICFIKDVSITHDTSAELWRISAWPIPVISVWSD
jgi:hypothetical protein